MYTFYLHFYSQINEPGPAELLCSVCGEGKKLCFVKNISFKGIVHNDARHTWYSRPAAAEIESSEKRKIPTEHCLVGFSRKPSELGEVQRRW